MTERLVRNESPAQKQVLVNNTVEQEPQRKSLEYFNKQFDELVERARTDVRTKANEYVAELWGILKRKWEWWHWGFTIKEQADARKQIMSACKDIWAKSTIVEALNRLSPESINQTKSKTGKASASVRKANRPRNIYGIGGVCTLIVTLSKTNITRIMEVNAQGKDVELAVDIGTVRVVNVIARDKSNIPLTP